MRAFAASLDLLLWTVSLASRVWTGSVAFRLLGRVRTAVDLSSTAGAPTLSHESFEHLSGLDLPACPYPRPFFSHALHSVPEFTKTPRNWAVVIDQVTERDVPKWEPRHQCFD